MRRRRTKRPASQSLGKHAQSCPVYAIITHTIMKKRAPILPYLILNILVSAGTVLLVLFLWQRFSGMSLPIPNIPLPDVKAEPTLQRSTSPATAIPPASSADVCIEMVAGVGNRDLEYILVRNQSESAVDLAAWQISASGGRSYTFPPLKLNKNGAVRLYTRSGTDTVIELFWNSAEALWKSGDEITLLEPGGSARSTYLIP